MSNQVVIPFPQRRRSTEPPVEQPRRAKILARLSTARGLLAALIETLSYMGDGRVKRPLLPAAPVTK